jgi:hypothetical protein
MGMPIWTRFQHNERQVQDAELRMNSSPPENVCGKKVAGFGRLGLLLGWSNK